MNYLGVLSTLLICLVSGAQAQTIVPLQLIQTIPLPGVEGYLDHMAIDLEGQRLFIPAEHQKTIEVVGSARWKTGAYGHRTGGQSPQDHLSGQAQPNLG